MILSNEKLFKLLKNVRDLDVLKNTTNAGLVNYLFELPYRDCYLICETQLNIDPDGFKIKVKEL